MAEIEQIPTAPVMVRQLLEHLLDHAKKGELRSLVGVVSFASEEGPKYMPIHAGDWPLHLPTHLGMLTMLEHELLDVIHQLMSADDD